MFHKQLLINLIICFIITKDIGLFLDNRWVEGELLMSYKNLNYIIELAEQQNVSRAAEKLFISQSALSIYLKKLESELGVNLFLRQNNKLIPTEKGNIVISTAREILRLENEMYEQLTPHASSPVHFWNGYRIGYENIL